MRRLFILAMLVAVCARPALAHRLDEYLQATLLTIGPGQLQGTMRLVPGVAVAPRVIARIDTNHDGILSREEQCRYAEEVLSDLRVQAGDLTLHPQLIAATFPSIDQMKAGTGEIEISFEAALPGIRGPQTLTFENKHQKDISVYLVNSLVPQDKSIQLGAQQRNQNQSWYRLDFAVSAAGNSEASAFTWSGFGATFRLGTRHIAAGTDHLLFLLTLLLPAPLLATAARWTGRSTIRRSLLHVLRIVTAFTLGHSLTLAVAGFGLVRLPSRPVEVLIAVSILVSAVHAVRPLFPGREAFIAASFGLIHGLAFASALNELGFTGWYHMVSVLGFNLGIEAMQLAVVAATLPALLLLSRTRFYGALRLAGAAFAVFASVSWIIERSINRPTVIGENIERFAQHGYLFALVLWACGTCAWLVEVNRPRTAIGSLISPRRIAEEDVGFGPPVPVRTPEAQ